LTEHLSPEQRLLRLIKGKQRSVSNAPDVSGNTAAGGAGADLTRSVRSEPWLSGEYSPQAKPVLRVELFLQVALGMSFLYLVFMFSIPFFSPRTLPVSSAAQSAAAKQVRFPEKDTIKSFESYASQLQGKNVFALAAATAATVTMQQTNVLAASEQLKDISLIGVISGDDPQAVIEDKRTQKTYYVNKGQFIEQFQVEDIKDGKIVLTCGGERFELSL